jgi:hypothetical protein
MLQHPALAQFRGLTGIRRESAQVDIRLAAREDAPALVRLAQLDSALAAAAELPGLAARHDVLIAEHDHEVVAALSLRDGLLVSDPFYRTDGLVRLLQERRRQLAAQTPRHRLGVLRPRHL